MRTTIKKEAEISGTGLHTGNKCSVVFRPSQVPGGLRFFCDGFKSPVKAGLDSVSGTLRGTSISDGVSTVHTVEHLLSAAFALGIDDMDMEISGSEPPVCDGSALAFAEALLKAGITEKEGPSVPAVKLGEPFEFRADRTFYRISPSAGSFSLRLTYEHPHKLIGRQTVDFTLSPENYLKYVAPARTFGFSYELEMLKAAGLAKGGSLDNAVVITEDEMLAKDGLRFPDELARHKLLDLLGDLALAGLRFEGLKLEAVRPGHTGNVNFARLLKQRCKL